MSYTMFYVHVPYEVGEDETKEFKGYEDAAGRIKISTELDSGIGTTTGTTDTSSKFTLSTTTSPEPEATAANEKANKEVAQASNVSDSVTNISMTTTQEGAVVSQANLSTEAPSPTTVPAPTTKPVVKPSAGSSMSNETKRSNTAAWLSRQLSKQDTFNLVKALKSRLEKLGITKASWNPTTENEFWQVTFPVEGVQSDTVLNSLIEIGIGNNNYSDISLVPITVHFPSLLDKDEINTATAPSQEKISSFVSSVKSRLSVAQVINVIKPGATLTFDYIMLILMASIIAAIGLVENNSVLLVASMLVSPLMGPILGSADIF